MKSRSYPSILHLFCYAIILTGFLSIPPIVFSDPWWTNVKIEETRPIENNLTYTRSMYSDLQNEPVRAHVLSVTGVGHEYIFGVLGSYGALFPPTEYAKHSEAIAVINGGFFSKNPNRALGLVVAHNRVLYPPYSGGHIRGAVGFSSTDVLFDWIGQEDIDGYRFRSEKEGWNECHAALGAGPILIKKGQSRIQTELEGFNKEQRAPRSAIAKLNDGSILLMVVDGRQPDWSAGVTLEELAELLLIQHAVDALNLDGGGSSLMAIKGEIINRPSDLAMPGAPGQERAVANVVALFKK